MWRLSRARLMITAAVLVAITAAAWVAWGQRPGIVSDIEASDTRADKPIHKDKRKVSTDQRAALLRRAQVWQAPTPSVPDVTFAGQNLDELSCRFKVDELGGTTPKFDCVLESGEEVRIKYGNGPEVPAEAAATRLLDALGFGADAVTLVKKIRCYGCPKEPFSAMKVVDLTRTEPLYERVVNYESYQEFEWVALERRFEARPIETDGVEGWSFFELDTVDATQGGAPREHVDALRVMAVMLAHWDNKAENQRMVCLDPEWPPDASCGRPFLLLQDVGATFGPAKMDLAAWEQFAVWADRTTCRLSMRGLPFGGATFADATVSERGRQFVGKLLSQLSDAQVAQLFEASRFGESRGAFAPVSPVHEWVRVFKSKVHDITSGPACPLA